MERKEWSYLSDCGMCYKIRKRNNGEFKKKKDREEKKLRGMKEN